MANALGRGSSVVVWILVLPAYLSLLGVEAFGLVGLYIGLQSLVGVIDYAVGTALLRELAQAPESSDAGPDARRTVRTLEVLYVAGGAAFAITAALAAPWIAENWVRPATLTTEQVRASITWMGVALGLQLLVALYTNGLFGRNQHILANTVTVTGSLARGFGGLAVLVFLSQRVESFFLFQVAIMGLQVVFAGVLLHRCLPGRQPARFDLRVLSRIGRFTAGATGVVVVNVLFAQADKIYLSRALDLGTFGTYAIAVTLGAGVYFLATPVFVSTFPRMCRAWSQQDAGGPSSVYHQTSQLVSIAILPPLMIMLLFPAEVLRVWTGQADVVSRAAPFLQLLVVGFAVLGWDGVHRNLQFAAGRTSLALTQSMAALALYVPLLVLLTATYGASGAAAAFCIACIASTALGAFFTHTRVLKGELGSWLRTDLLVPALAAGAVAIVARSLLPIPASRVGAGLALVGVGLVAVAAAALASPTARRMARDHGQATPLDADPR